MFIATIRRRDDSKERAQKGHGYRTDTVTVVDTAPQPLSIVPTMLIHAVYIWLKADLSDAQKAAHLASLKALSQIPETRFFHVGTPASTDRPVIDRTYSYALVVGCDDEAALERYRGHALHKAFGERVAECWDRQIVYDSVEVS